MLGLALVPVTGRWIDAGARARATGRRDRAIQRAVLRHQLFADGYRPDHDKYRYGTFHGTWL